MRQTVSLLLVLLAVSSVGRCHWWRLPAVGESCTELVRNPARCEEQGDVTETVERADEMEGFGPNVCVTETVETVNASDYVVERSCFGFFCR
jgi:hypothetical protein